MRIKTKLFTGIGSLFLLIVFLSVLAGYNISQLSDDSSNILSNNYSSVKYAIEMLAALNGDMDDSSVLRTFEHNLELQQQNITEIGEKNSTHALIEDYNRFKEDTSDSTYYSALREDLLHIISLNMETIQKRSNIAGGTADNAIKWITAGSILCLIMALSLLLFMPRNIANPIHEFTESIQNIAARNYSERVILRRNDEFQTMAVAFNTMAEKLQEYNSSNLERVLAEKKRIEALVDNIQEPVIGLDENSNILFMNNKALQITNLQKEEVIGKPAQEIAAKNDLMQTLIRDLSVTKPSSVPLKIYFDNKESYFQKEIMPMNIVPTGETSAQHIGSVIFLKNITSLKELDSAKTNLMATVSHELKTPISSIKMSTQLLENKKIGSLNTEQSQLIESINEDLERLLNIVGELLNMTQIETGNIQLSIIPANPREILDYAVSATKVQAEQKSIHFSTIYSEQVPPVLADREKTAWVLINLITNAIRYSHEGSTIYLTVSTKGDRVLFSVRDTGQGILPEYREKIFERYFKVPGSNKSGTGLGLSISKEFIEAQGGKISLRSEYGEGSEFTVSLNKSEERFI
ncbi:sensor histidine kinase [Proteiniphilum sp.]|uniref:sensor histidine kinase n=1 Tax=Proteiniphilum sp. TaxID=1926877 RepID=UPI002B1ECDA6|nr:ATP-binding protein [Proteiniphilum sp.]MEA4917184.1 ATP-binding protein [Proteiniphilum sp.]